jgi:hypothetical protein
MTEAAPHPSSPGRRAPHAIALAAALLLMRTGGATAFPLLDATNADQTPPGAELATSDVNDLQHQLQLVNGFGPPAGGGWTFVPRIDLQEALTDNVFQLNSPRRADLVSYFSPGISLAGDLPRVQLSFDFAPTLAVYARTGDLNSLTEQMNGLGSITLVPDLAYVDVRAIAGVQNLNGGIGGIGAVGAPAGAAATTQATIPSLAGNNQGLSRDTEVQTTSFGVSPYLLRQFGDWGTAKLGYSLNVSESDQLSGFAASPFPTGGANAQTLVSNEEIAHFVTGDFMSSLQNSFDIDLQQNHTTSGAGSTNFVTGLPEQSTQNTSSTREIFNDRITYQLTRGFSVFASGGHEDIVYTGLGAQSIHDLIWSLGATLVPNPDSSLTLSYGHQDGFNSVTANAYYALTARTRLSASYGSTLGTQLEYVQNQLNLATASPNGTLVNARTGGSLFGTTNALAVRNGVFRTSALTLGSQTTLDRDIISINFLLAKQQGFGGAFTSTTESKTAGLSWLHQLRPDMTVSAAFSYAIQDQSAGAISTFNPGNNTSIAATLAWWWQISDTVSANVRYTFLQRSTDVTQFDFYQNILILGITKRF